MATFNIDGSHTSVTFSVRHLMISTVRGEFQKVSGQLQYDPAAVEASTLSVTVELASVNTREEKRDAHLRSDDFFAVEKHPHMTFVSTKVEKAGSGLAVTGDLTIRGVTKSVTLAVDEVTGEQVDPWGMRRIGASAHGKIKRSDFGIVWNGVLEAGGVVVSDEVKIQLDASFVKAS
jgi:polyisoprenoid-binding protein YceI